MQFESDDWKDFQSLTTLGRKAGVAQNKLAMVVAKELTDNALDAAGAAAVGLVAGNGFYVADDGPGIAGDDRAIASCFSMNRPLRSSKRLRLPTRGALGNGLRVVAGAVFASTGSLVVSTSGRTLRLIPLESGETAAEPIDTHKGRGTRVEVRLGPALRVDEATLAWAREALALAGTGARYKGKPSPYWFESDAFYQLLRDAGAATVRQVIAEFDGCSEPKAGKIAKPFGTGRPAREIDRDEAEQLLKSARTQARPVTAKRLGQIGTGSAFPAPYKLKRGTFTIKPSRGKLPASIPYVVEASAAVADATPSVRVSINRTPVTAEVESYYNAKKRTLTLFGCGLQHAFPVGREPIDVRINIDTPYMPITSDGKAPDLARFLGTLPEVLKSVGNAARRQASRIRVDKVGNQEAIVLEHLERAIAKVSGGGQTRYSLRQLYYALRPYLIEATGDEPNYKTFAGIITRIENRRGEDLPGIYRDSRGTLYHPHNTGASIPLGTLNVECYRRPEWTFNKILYCEKEGFFPILIAARWAERHDCALVTSKGFATRAARDVLDLLGDADKALQFFCIHDADAYGTRIYQALRTATQARPERTVEIINLGLEPEEARALGLQVEEVNRKSKRLAPVGDYVEAPWRDWLQKYRVELNAMDTPQFLEWLDRKFASHAGKVVPPAGVLQQRLIDAVKDIHREAITAEVLRHADVEGQVERAYRTMESELLDRIPRIEGEIAHHLRGHPADLWSESLHRIAREIAG